MMSSPYSIAQMPVPVPISRTHWAVSAPGHKVCLPSNVNLKRWFCKSASLSESITGMNTNNHTYLAVGSQAEIITISILCDILSFEIRLTSSFGSMYSNFIRIYIFQPQRGSGLDLLP